MKGLSMKLRLSACFGSTHTETQKMRKASLEIVAGLVLLLEQGKQVNGQKMDC